MEPKQQPPYPLRMPPEMRAQLEGMAETAKRSLNAEIVARLAERQTLRDRVESLTNELQERNEAEGRMHGLLAKAQAMFGLFLGRLREAKSKLTADEAEELNALLADIQGELERPEAVDVLFERARALQDELDAVKKRLGELGADVPEETAERVADLEAKWTRVKSELATVKRTS